MMAGTYVAYVVVAWCYWGVGLSGYYAFGETPRSRSPAHAWRPVTWPYVVTWLMDDS